MMRVVAASVNDEKIPSINRSWKLMIDIIFKLLNLRILFIAWADPSGAGESRE
jgi:hypothetical protein